jgi:hypothetical protein
LFLLDAGVGKIDGDGIIIIGGQQLDRGKQFFYADSFDAASSMEGCGKVNIRKPICESGLETGIDKWIKANIIQPLVPAAGPPAGVPDYFIHAGCNFKKAIILEMTVYADINMVKRQFQSLFEKKTEKKNNAMMKLEEAQTRADEAGGSYEGSLLDKIEEQAEIGKAEAAAEEKKAQDATLINYNLDQTKLRYLLCFPKNPSSVIVSVSCPFLVALQASLVIVKGWHGIRLKDNRMPLFRI